MRQPVIHAAVKGQEGFSLLAILGIIIVLSFAGSVAFKNVKADISYSGHDLDRVRADFLAESAIHWALAETGKNAGDGLPYTRATHANDSWHRLPDRLTDGTRNPRKLDRTRMVSPYPGKPVENTEGWVSVRNIGKATSVTGAAEEEMEFMVWFPDDATMRIRGRGKADRTLATVEFQARLKDALVGY